MKINNMQTIWGERGEALLLVAVATGIVAGARLL